MGPCQLYVKSRQIDAIPKNRRDPKRPRAKALPAATPSKPESTPRPWSSRSRIAPPSTRSPPISTPASLPPDPPNASKSMSSSAPNGASVRLRRNHALAVKANRRDYHRRILEWFDVHLKDQAPQPWIENGVTVLDREGVKRTRKIHRSELGQPPRRLKQWSPWMQAARTLCGFPRSAVLENVVIPPEPSFGDSDAGFRPVDFDYNGMAHTATVHDFLVEGGCRGVDE